MRYIWAKLLISAAALGSLSASAGSPKGAPCNCGQRQMAPIAPQPMAPMMMPPVGMVPVHSHCPPVVSVVPQPQAVYRTETTTVMQPVTRKVLEREAYTVDVPVTTHRQVTVDEGGYQQVWVPKLVTRTVPETAVRKEVHYRTVEREITQNVPQTVTRIVPQSPITTMAPPSVQASNSASGGPTSSSAPSPKTTPSEGITVPSPYSPPATSSAPQANQGQSSQWTKIPQKASESTAGSEVELQSHEQREIAVPRKLFSPVAPSAATVWQAQGAFR